MPRFVVLDHETPPDYDRPPHFDLMLEAGTELRTFALLRWPAAGETVLCEQLADHRLAYLDYEGPISGGRGHVTRHDAGEYDIVKETSHSLVLELSGQRLHGTLTLMWLADSQRWEATWQPALSDA
ncbi:MAG: DNA polymerase ligase N-terminal domain-containing protein [Pirellulaceae bacterium]